MVLRSARLELEFVPAKLQAPKPYRSLIPRPRLLETASAFPVVLLVADAGYGKTSLLYQLSRLARRTIWYTLDARDRDPYVFALHLLKAAGADRALWEIRQVPEERLAQVLARLTLAEVEASSVSTLLVLDDYHTVMDDAVIEDTVAALLRDRPLNLRVAIASRRRLSLPVARLRAQGLVILFGPEDLCFDLKETRTIFAQDRLPDETIRQIQALTGGWPVAVQLVRDTLRAQPDQAASSRLSPVRWPEQFDAFLTEELLCGLDPAEIEVLCRVSVLEEVDAATCLALTGNPASLEVLEGLARRYSFIALNRGEGGCIYRIHALIRESLAARLPAEERQRLVVQAGHCFEQSNRPIDAARAFAAAGDQERLIQLVRREGERLLEQGLHRTLAEWFSHIPAGVVERDARLLALHAQLEAELGHFSLATAEFERVVPLLLGAGERGAAVEALRRLAGLQEHRGAYLEAFDTLTRALTLLSEDDDTRLRLRVENQRATLLLHSGRLEEALERMRQVIEQCRRAGDTRAEAIALHNLGETLSTLGRFSEARAAFTQALALKRALGLWASMALTLNSLGALCYLAGESAQAEQSLVEARSLAEQHEAPSVLSYALSNLGDLYRDWGETEVARELYQRSLELKEAMDNPFGTAHTLNCLATLCRRAGDLGQAREYNRRAFELREQAAGPIERLCYQEEAMLIALAAGEIETAARELWSIAIAFREYGARYHWVRAGWYAAYAGWRLAGHLPPEFDELVRIAAELGYTALLTQLVREAPDFAVAAWAAGLTSSVLAERMVDLDDLVLPHIERGLAGHAEQAARLVDLLLRLPGNMPIQVLTQAARSLNPDVARAATTALERLRAAEPPPLRIEALGGLRVWRRGRPVPERAWARRRALDLLAYLLLAGPGGATRDELIAACWPDTAVKSAIQQFHQHLRTLRSALEPESLSGSSRYVLTDGRMYRLAFDRIEYWDVSAFERALEQARTLQRAGDLASAEQSFAQASALYRGPLFAGIAPEDDWLDRARERYAYLAVEANLQLGALRESTGNLLGAVDAYTACVELDLCREDAHRALMRLYEALGRRDDALAQYRRCVAALRRELGVGPMPETTALYQRIRNHL